MSAPKRMSAREGRAFKNGQQISSLAGLTTKFVPEVSKKRVVGQRGMSAKVIGYDITGTIKRFKVDKFIADLIKEYTETGIFPKFDIQAVHDDKDSDYFEQYGECRVQLLNVQLEGDLPVITLDSEGEEILEEVEFSAEEIRFI